MPPEDLLRLLRHRPFIPFRLHVSDGTTYEVNHSEMLIVSPESAVVGLPMQPFPLARWEIVALAHIVRVEPLETVKASGNGN